MHFCLIDDDPHLLETLQRGLVELGHECETYQSSVEGLARMLDTKKFEPDVLLLDVMMPEMDGWEVLAKLREAGMRTAVIYVSARRDVDDRVRGLMLTADDYVVKPFALKELLARAESVLRRKGYQEPVSIEGLVIYRTRHRVEYKGRVVDLSAREYGLLELLASDAGRVWTRPELLKRLWDMDFDPQTNVVEVLVARMRRRLGPEASKLVETVVGEGYRLKHVSPAHG